MQGNTPGPGLGFKLRGGVAGEPAFRLLFPFRPTAFAGVTPMDTQAPPQSPPDTFQAASVSPPVAPPPGGNDKLEQILPQLRDLAQKVGGFGKLADLARQLERNEG
jgi:hypothetical protein